MEDRKARGEKRALSPPQVSLEYVCDQGEAYAGSLWGLLGCGPEAEWERVQAACLLRWPVPHFVAVPKMRVSCWAFERVGGDSPS